MCSVVISSLKFDNKSFWNYSKISVPKMCKIVVSWSLKKGTCSQIRRLSSFKKKQTKPLELHMYLYHTRIRISNSYSQIKSPGTVETVKFGCAKPKQKIASDPVKICSIFKKKIANNMKYKNKRRKEVGMLFYPPLNLVESTTHY